MRVVSGQESGRFWWILEQIYQFLLHASGRCGILAGYEQAAGHYLLLEIRSRKVLCPPLFQLRCEQERNNFREADHLLLGVRKSGHIFSSNKKCAV